jgi:hypothetical protein
LGHLADRLEFRRQGANHQFLQAFDLAGLLVRRSTVDTALQSVYRCLNLGPTDVSPIG